MTIERPDDRQHQHVPATHFEDRTEVHYARTDEPGTYRMRYMVDGKERQLHYVVNASRDESDLTPLTDDQWKKLENDVGFELIDPAQPR